MRRYNSIFGARRHSPTAHAPDESDQAAIAAARPIENTATYSTGWLQFLSPRDHRAVLGNHQRQHRRTDPENASACYHVGSQPARRASRARQPSAEARPNGSFVHARPDAMYPRPRTYFRYHERPLASGDGAADTSAASVGREPTAPAAWTHTSNAPAVAPLSQRGAPIGRRHAPTAVSVAALE